MLQPMGGRGFPYCTFINADGVVIWEARPASADAFKDGLANAKKLAAMQAELVKNPNDKVLAANIALLDVSGRGQRPKPSMDELAEHASVKGADPELVAKFEAMKHDETIKQAMGKYRDDKGKATYLLYKSGVKPAEGASTLIGYYRYAAEGAVESGQADDARKLIELFRESGKGNARLADRIAKDCEALLKRVDEIKDK
jgi:hypothetical protein